MGKYIVQVVRHYRHKGTIEIDATSEVEAHTLALKQIDDIELELDDLVEGQDTVSIYSKPKDECPVALDPIQQNEIINCLYGAVADLEQLQKTGVVFNGVMRERFKQYTAMLKIIDEEGL